jgi:hypothetical protein
MSGEEIGAMKKRQATLARQTAEWRMRMIQTLFPWIKDQFVYRERGERRICLKMLVLIYNMRARMVGINQIRNTYMKHLRCVIFLDTPFFRLAALCTIDGQLLYNFVNKKTLYFTLP